MRADVIPFPRGVFARRVELLAATMQKLAHAMERANLTAERAAGLVTHAERINLVSGVIVRRRARRSRLAALALQQAAPQVVGPLPLALGLGDQAAGGARERAARLHGDAELRKQRAGVLDGAGRAVGGGGAGLVDRGAERLG